MASSGGARNCQWKEFRFEAPRMAPRSICHQGVVWVSGHAPSPEIFFVFKVTDFGEIQEIKLTY